MLAARCCSPPSLAFHTYWYGGCCAVLCCAVLCCAVLCCAVLCQQCQCARGGALDKSHFQFFSGTPQWHGKVHFGIILGWSVCAAIALWFVAKNIAGDTPDVAACDLYSCYCVLGYCLLPMVAFSIFSILLPRCAVLLLTNACSHP